VNNRVTNSMMARTVLYDAGNAAHRLRTTERKLSSGKELDRPSDDPYGVSRAITLRGDIEGTRQFTRNAQEAISWQDVSDSALDAISSVTLRARELLLRGASDTGGQIARDAIAAEIDQLVDAAKEHADATYGNRFVFAGTATTTRPYVVGGADTYAGDAGTISRQIGPGVALAINVRSVDLLGNGQLANDGLLLDNLRDVAQHLRGGTAADVSLLRGVDLRALDANLDKLNQSRALIGAGTNRLLSALDRLGEVDVATTKLLSDVEDTDMAGRMVDFSIQKAAYEAALKAGANIVQVSLLDFLR